MTKGVTREISNIVDLVKKQENGYKIIWKGFPIQYWIHLYFTYRKLLEMNRVINSSFYFDQVSSYDHVHVHKNSLYFLADPF